MLFADNKNTSNFKQHFFLSIVFTFAFAISSNAQTGNVKSNSNNSTLNPLLLSSFKKPIKANPLLAEHIKPAKSEIMYWPNYPLTASQIEARNSQWERRSQQPLVVQIASDIAGEIIKNQVNSLIYGKKMPVAVKPKF